MPSEKHVRTNYDVIASAYDRRYAIHDYPGVRATLLRSIESSTPRRVLEVGCGTGRWLALLASAGCQMAGIDPSREMLARAATRVAGDLRQGVAERLPWGETSFDAVVYVNALHHCSEPDVAVLESTRVLRPGGRLISIGLDPHAHTDEWYLYDFFPDALTYDRARFPSASMRTGWLRAAGLTDLSVTTAEDLRASMSYAEARRRGVLERSFTSQFTAVSDAAYAVGLQRLETAAEDPAFRLVANLRLYATEGTKPR